MELVRDSRVTSWLVLLMLAVISAEMPPLPPFKPPPSLFYPFGPESGDDTAPSNDDGSAGPLETEFTIFGRQHKLLFVSCISG